MPKGHLVLSAYPLHDRRCQEIVCVLSDGREVIITVQDVEGDRVSLGLQADTDIRIYRRRSTLGEEEKKT